MKIVCIGWGSLIWDQGDLKTKGNWNNNGPKLPIEFARQSQNGRITLVIEENAAPLTTLWILMDTNSISEACESLMKREGTASRHIHYISNKMEPKNSIQKTILSWLESKDLDCAIWTGLPPKFNKEDFLVPTVPELFDYFDNLTNDTLELVKEYIIKTPKQIDTKVRQEIEKRYDWK